MQFIKECLLLFDAFNRKLRDAVDAIDIQQDIDAELNNAEVVFKLAQLVSSAYFLLQTAPSDMCDRKMLCVQSVHQVRLAIQRANPKKYTFVADVEHERAQQIAHTLLDKVVRKVVLETMSKGLGSPQQLCF